MLNHRDERWSFTKRLIDRWWPPVRKQDGVPEEEIVAAEQRLGLRLPDALREWYQFAGRRGDFIGSPDRIVDVRQLAIDGGVLVFCIENQAVVDWGIHVDHVDQVDPPVLVSDGDRKRWVDGRWSRNEWLPQSDSVSDFIAGMVMLATVLCGKFNGFGESSSREIEQIVRHYDRLYGPTTFCGAMHGDADTVILWYNRRDPDNIWVATRTRDAMDQFLGVVGQEWGDIQHRGRDWAHSYGDDCRDVPPPYIITDPLPGWLDIHEPVPPCHDPDRCRG